MAKQYWKPGNMLYPVPVVMVTCQRAGEKPNIITVAWAGTVCTDPPMVSISVRRERYSYGIIRDTGEFVVNLTARDLAWAADFCGVCSGRDLDKFAQAGLTPCASKVVGCPGIAESPVNIECRVAQVKHLGSHDLFLANVVSVGVEESLLDETGRLQLSRSGLTVYSHGCYFELGRQIGSFGYSVKKKTAGSKADRSKCQGKSKKAGSQGPVSGKKQESKKAGKKSRRIQHGNFSGIYGPASPVDRAGNRQGRRGKNSKDN